MRRRRSLTRHSPPRGVMCKFNFGSIEATFEFDLPSASRDRRGATGPCLSRYPSWGGLGGVECDADAILRGLISAFHSLCFIGIASNASHLRYVAPASQFYNARPSGALSIDARPRAARVAPGIAQNYFVCSGFLSFVTHGRPCSVRPDVTLPRPPRLLRCNYQHITNISRRRSTTSAATLGGRRHLLLPVRQARVDASRPRGGASPPRSLMATRLP